MQAVSFKIEDELYSKLLKEQSRAIMLCNRPVPLTTVVKAALISGVEGLSKLDTRSIRTVYLEIDIIAKRLRKQNQ